MDQAKRLKKKKQREERLRKIRHHRQEQERLGDLMYYAESAYAGGDNETAVRHCRSILASFPNHIPALSLLSNLLHERSQTAEAGVLAEKLAALEPENETYAWNRIVNHLERQDGAEAAALARAYDDRFHPRGKKQADLRLILMMADEIVRRTAPKRPAPPVPPSEKPRDAARKTAPAAVRSSEPAKPSLPLLTPEIRADIEIDTVAVQEMISRHSGGDLFWLRQRLRMEHVRMQNEFEELLCIPTLSGVRHFSYQTEAVRKVLKVYRGRVLLADEVGLGKTIEAAMVLKEYLLRGMVKSALILCPPSLVKQWTHELRDKFGITAVAPSVVPRAGRAVWSRDLVVASIHTAKGRVHSEAVLARPWDMVIVDEAHHLRNRRTLGWSLINSIRKKYLLLLSATPVQNNLGELYNLITLLKPGTFPPEKEFLRIHAGDGRVPRNAEQLRLLMRDCMIRNTRAGCGVPFPKRFAATFTVHFSPVEIEIYEGISALAHTLYASGNRHARLSARVLLERAGAHPPLALGTLRSVAAWLGGKDAAGVEGANGAAAAAMSLMEKAARLEGPTEKISKLLSLLGETSKPVIVFCRHTATVNHLCGSLLTAGVSYASFHGAMPVEQRADSIERFRNGEVQVLLSSESGGEGQNLQFCDTIVNFDLPWNPMQIEQRIGRIHRIGQDRDVYVFNLCYADSLEEKILSILEGKIRMFELVIGEVDSILGELDEQGGFSEVVLDLWLQGSDGESRRRSLDQLGDSLERSRSEYLEACRLDDALFGRELEA